MKPIAHIEDWIMVTADNGTKCLVGKVMNHPHQRRFQSNMQITSPIVRMPGLGIVETVNTVYCLGRARKDYLNPEVV